MMLTDQEIIRKAESFLKRKFDSAIYLNEHPKDKAYRIEHSYRVANIGHQIALGEGFNIAEMVAGCLLHDVSYCEEFSENGWKDHGRRSANIARPFLEELGFAKERIDDICYGIAIHVDDKADFDGDRTPFALSIGDADNIDRFDVYRIHESLLLDGFLDKTLEDKLAYAENRLSRLKDLRNMTMATETAGKMWRSRIDFYILYYEKLTDQLLLSRSISGM